MKKNRQKKKEEEKGGSRIEKWPRWRRVVSRRPCQEESKNEGAGGRVVLMNRGAGRGSSLLVIVHEGAERKQEVKIVVAEKKDLSIRSGAGQEWKARPRERKPVRPPWTVFRVLEPGEGRQGGKSMKKKVIAVLLSLSLAAGSVPGYAAAEEPGGPEGEIVVVEEEGPQEAAAPEEPEMEEAAELPAEAPAEDALIVEDGVEIAGIEELEIPAEDAVSEDEQVVTDEVAVNTAEISEDPEIELVGDEEAEEADVADPDSQPESDKTDEAAYASYDKNKQEAIISPQLVPRLTVEFRDRETKGNTFSPVVPGKNSIKARYVKTTTGQEYYWMKTNQEAVYDPNYKEEIKADPNHYETEKDMKILPELKLTWRELNDEITTLREGIDYEYYLVNVDKVTFEYKDPAYIDPQKVEHAAVTNAGGEAGRTLDTNGVPAVIEITFRGHYKNLTKLRMQYTVVKKSLDEKETRNEVDKVRVDITEPVFDATDKAYYFTYDGKPHRPVFDEETGVTYKGVPLKKTQETNPTNILKLTGDWYAVTDPQTRASERKSYGIQYYNMMVKGLGNYEDYALYKYAIRQKEVEKGDVEGLDNRTFFIEVDEDEIASEINKSLVNKLEDKSLGDTERTGGYVIYYYKIEGGEEIPFTNENFPNAPGANKFGTGAPGFDDINGNGVFDATDPTKPGDKTPYEKRIDPTDRKAVEAVCGEYTYRIEFTGEGNFKEKKAKDSPITGRFTVTDDEPHLTNVYNSLKDELVKALNNTLDPTYDATDWFKRDGGSSNSISDANDVEEMVKAVFNTYKYKKKDNSGKVIEYKAGDNIEVSLHPQHNGKMINADRNGNGKFDGPDGDKSDGYVIRIKGINDWKDDLSGDGYIYMDEPDELIYVDPRSLDLDDNNNPSLAKSDLIDYAGNGSSWQGDYIDRFYIKGGLSPSYEVGNAELYITDPYKENDIYKYGAIQYLKEYNKPAAGYADPMVTITHLVRDTEDTKDYPVAKTQVAVNNAGESYNESNYEANVKIWNTSSSQVSTKEKELIKGEDFIVGAVSADKNKKLWTKVTGMGNYQGTIIVPTVRRDMVNLENGVVTVRVKSIDGVDDFNTEKYVVQKSKEEGGLKLVYKKGAGVDVKEDNVEVRFNGTLISPKDYDVVIDERSVNHLCQNCQKIDTVGRGRHITAGWHQIIVKGSSTVNCTGFKEAKFYLRSNLNFGSDYEGVWDKEKMAAQNPPYDPETAVVVGQKLGKNIAPHNYVKVVNKNSSETVELNYREEYDYECYIPKAQWDAAYNKDKGTLENLDTKYRLDVVDGVEFPVAGDWYLVFKPINRANTRVEEYEGYVCFPFTVQQKDFASTKENGKIKVEVLKDSITWPGYEVTGPEVATMLRVEDTEKFVDAGLVYGEDYTIRNNITTVGSYTAELVGMGNYKDAVITADPIEVKQASLANAKVEVGGSLYYKQEAFKGDVTGVDKDSLKLDVSVMLKSDIDGSERTVKLISPDYTVAADGVSETGEVGTDVQITVTGTGNYKDAAPSATAKIAKADISNEDIFELAGIPIDPLVCNGEKVELPLTLTDKRNQKTVELKPEYVGNDKAGTATVTITPANTDNYEGKIEKTFKLIDEELAGRIELNAESFPFKEDNYTPADVIKAVYDKNGTEITSDKYTAAIKGDAKNAGTATVVVTTTIDGKEVSLEKTFTIEPRKITNVTNLEATYVYNRNVIRPDVKVEADGIILQNKDYVIYNTEDPNVGAKEIVVQAIGNYTGNIAKQFTVVPASVEGASITGVKASYKYNGTARQPKVKVTVNGKVLKKDVDYKVTYSADSTAVGGKTATIEGTGNYTGSQVKAYSVVPAKAVVKSVKAGKKKLTVKVNAQAGVKYQIQYKVSGDDTWSSAKTAETKKVLKHLTSGKKYDIRVRAFATIDGARVNGAWSKVTVKKVK